MTKHSDSVDYITQILKTVSKATPCQCPVLALSLMHEEVPKHSARRTTKHPNKSRTIQHLLAVTKTYAPITIYT
jgi:hypothetical protein